MPAQEQIMRKYLVMLIALVVTLPVFAQTSTPTKKKKFNLSNRSSDHFLLQISKDSWMGADDSVSNRIKGFSKGFNSYLMLDLPFKSDQRFSAALGLGVGTSSIGFKKTYVNISAQTPKLPFTPVDSLEHFKKFKLATTYLELPLELRFTANPETPGKTVKAAIGVKIGTLLNAHTKGKTLQDKSNNTINNFTEKINSKSYFNSTRFSATARVGYSYFSLFGSYTFTSLFKDAVAPNTKLLQIGITISGL